MCEVRSIGRFRSRKISNGSPCVYGATPVCRHPHKLILLTTDKQRFHSTVTSGEEGRRKKGRRRLLRLYAFPSCTVQGADFPVFLKSNMAGVGPKYHLAYGCSASIEAGFCCLYTQRQFCGFGRALTKFHYLF
jgi:hypothetical protein